MPSELQIRAERAAAKFARDARKTLVVEFAGLPKAGKTTIVNNLQTFLRRCGFRVEVVVERASVSPIKDKLHPNFNAWTACTTLTQILEKTQNPPRPDDPQILILDRGLFDSIWWLALWDKLARLRPAEREIFERFFTLDDWKNRISLVVLLTATPSDAIARDQGLIPLVGKPGRIMREDVLEQMLLTIRETANRLRSDFNLFEIDTSAGDTANDPKRTAELVTTKILSLIEEQLGEDVLFLPRETVVRIFDGKTTIREQDASELVRAFGSEGQYAARELVEASPEFVQAVPVVIVRNKTGEVLRLRRRERNESNPLHEKIVLWAGGHVRREDSDHGDSLVKCIMRELEEELRLSVEPHELVLLGAVYVMVGEKTARHVAVIYQWSADTDSVAIALSEAEFFERRGTALSGTFVDTESLVFDIETKKISEVWSTEIARELLLETSAKFQPRLF